MLIAVATNKELVNFSVILAIYIGIIVLPQHLKNSLYNMVQVSSYLLLLNYNNF